MTQARFGAVVHQLRRLSRAAAAHLTDEELLEAFAREHDEGAFATLVGRHAPLVMSVCRRTLGHHHDAEDAFQATFLVLARGAGSVRRRGGLAAWLHGVAFRIAMNAKRGLSRQRRKDRAGARPEAAAPPDLSWREVQALLDEQVQALPEIYRQVFVLCCLQGASKPEAARQLGLKEGTVASRLARARSLLRQRLAKRGVSLSTLLVALDLTREGTQASVAALEATARCAVAYAAGACASSAVPARVAALAEGVSTVLITRTKMMVVALVTTLLAAGVGVLLAPLAAREPQGPEKTGPRPAREKAQAKKEAVARTGEVHGRVLDPDGKPVKGARVYRVFKEPDSGPERKPRLLAVSQGGGAFRVRRSSGADDPSARWLAVAEGFGAALAGAAPAGQALTLRLVRDHPVTGRIVNLEGKPIKGVIVRPILLGATGKGDLGPWIEAGQGKRLARLDDFLPHQVAAGAGLPGLPGRLTTDGDGRFRLEGVGRERLVVLAIGGPAVESDLLLVVTRGGKAFRIGDFPHEEGPEHLVHPAAFQYAAGPPRPVRGTVRDRQTGKPIAGVVIDLGVALPRATTKKDGTYRLDSLPGPIARQRGLKSFPAIAIPPSDRPYLPAHKKVSVGRPSEPLLVDFALVLGVWAEGRVVDRRTGKPVRAVVEYHPEAENPNLKNFLDYAGPLARLGLFHTREDGSFRVPVLPGRGLLTAQATSGAYRPQEALPNDKARREFGLPSGLVNGYHAAVRINPKAGAGVKCDLAVDSGFTLACKVVGPDDRPVPGARVRGQMPADYWGARPLVGAEFTVAALHAKTPRWVMVLHPERKLGASVEVKAGAREPFVVRLGPTGTITGRLLDDTGRPWPRQALRVYFDRPGAGVLHNHLPEIVRCDDEGRFRVEGIIAGPTYQVVVAGKPPRTTIGAVKTGLTLKAGEVKALGDVKARMFRD